MSDTPSRKQCCRAKRRGAGTANKALPAACVATACSSPSGSDTIRPARAWRPKSKCTSKGQICSASCSPHPCPNRQARKEQKGRNVPKPAATNNARPERRRSRTEGASLHLKMVACECDFHPRRHCVRVAGAVPRRASCTTNESGHAHTYTIRFQMRNRQAKWGSTPPPAKLLLQVLASMSLHVRTAMAAIESPMKSACQTSTEARSPVDAVPHAG